MSKKEIINTMKNGLQSLNLDHLNCFDIFDVTEQNVE